jgi:hypothetical protein
MAQPDPQAMQYRPEAARKQAGTHIRASRAECGMTGIAPRHPWARGAGAWERPGRRITVATTGKRQVAKETTL